jgi:hypothetical protein
VIEINSLEAAEVRIADLERDIADLRTSGALVSELNKFPPPALTSRVGGADGEGRTYPDFLISGHKIICDLKYLLRGIGVDEMQLTHTLDFGSGCARAVRYLNYERFGGEKSGCDIDVEAIAWSKENVPGVSFFVSPYDPPLPQPDATFDFIYAISIFTHLSEQSQDLWLEELARVSKPNAVLILTKQGKNSSYERLPVDVKAKLDEEGIFYDETNIYYTGKTVGFEYPESFKLTFHSDKYVRKNWTRHFDIVDIAHRAIGFDQDAVILRPKRVATATTKKKK